MQAMVAALVAIPVIAGDAVANSDSWAVRGPTFSLTISPARLVVAPKAGLAVKNVTAYNTGRTPLNVDVVLTGFEQLRSGVVVFGRPGETSEPDWISIRPDSFHLSPGDKQHVHVRLKLPADLEPGDHQVGLTFLVPAETSNANLTLNRGVGAQMLIRAPGPVTKGTTLTALHLPSISTGGSVPLRLTMHNAGTVHRDFFAPDGLITATAGNDIVEFPDLTILGGVTRTADATWSHPPLFCHCEVTVSVPNGHGGTSTVTAHVWILPLYQILGALLFLVGITLLVRWRRRRHKAALTAARQQGYNDATTSEPDDRTVDPSYRRNSMGTPAND
jgi:hypothetical protein